MKQLAHAIVTTTAPPDRIYSLWADINNWHTFDEGIEWAKLEVPFKEGAPYTIKPKGGPKVKATVMSSQPPTRFVDTSHLLGAEMTFDHKINTTDDQATVEVVITLSGPMTWLWSRILGKNQQSELEASVKNLVHTAEQE